MLLWTQDTITLHRIVYLNHKHCNVIAYLPHMCMHLSLFPRPWIFPSLARSSWVTRNTWSTEMRKTGPPKHGRSFYRKAKFFRHIWDDFHILGYPKNMPGVSAGKIYRRWPTSLHFVGLQLRPRPRCNSTHGNGRRWLPSHRDWEGRILRMMTFTWQQIQE